MPSELRKILFTKDEVWSACISYCLQTRITLPKANIEDMVVGKKLDPAVTFYFSVDNVAQRSQVSLSREQVGAAMIRYCKEKGIPLPRTAQKLLVAEGTDLIAMMVNLNFHCQPTKPKTAKVASKANPEAAPAAVRSA